jgi:hypothetical protein
MKMIGQEIKESEIFLDMSRFGIDTVVITERELLVNAFEEFSFRDDSDWFQGLGKKKLYAFLKKEVIATNSYFNTNLDKANDNNEAWKDFCYDCVILTALDSCLFSRNVKTF